MQQQIVTLMRLRYMYIAFVSLCSIQAAAQPWTVQRCMRYAVEHNHEVRQAELELDSYKASRTEAIGRFLPEVGAGIGAQYNFGRAITPAPSGGGKRTSGKIL